MTMTRPWRRITLHLSQIFLTLGLTFIGLFQTGRQRCLTPRSTASSEVSGGLLVAVDDATPREVVRAQLHHHPVLGEDPDVVLAHLSRDVGEHLVAVRELHPKHG